MLDSLFCIHGLDLLASFSPRCIVSLLDYAYYVFINPILAIS